jgi:hypothetical protein
MLRSLNKNEEFVFKHPFRCYVAGPSCCGKTELLQKVLLNVNNLVDKPIERIVFCYSEWQKKYEIFNYLTPKVEMIQGIVKLDSLFGTIVLVHISYVGYHHLDIYIEVKPKQPLITVLLCSESYHLHETVIQSSYSFSSFIKGNNATHNEDSFLSGNNRKNSHNESNINQKLLKD